MTLAEFLAARLDESAEFVRIARLNKRTAGRILREVEAVRAILAEHAADEYGACSRCAGDSEPYEPPAAIDWPCPTVRALAGIYSDHPDYDEAWKP